MGWNIYIDTVEYTDATFNDICEILNGSLTATFTLPNTAANRALVDNDRAVEIYFNETLEFKGVLKGATFQQSGLLCLVYQTCQEAMQKKDHTSPVGGYDSVAPDVILAAVAASAGVLKGVCPSTPAISMRTDHAYCYDVARYIAWVLSKDIYPDFVGASAQINIGTAGSGDPSGRGILQYTTMPRRTKDRAQKRDKVLIRGLDADGLPLLGTAGTGTNVYVGTDRSATTQVTIDAIAAKKLADLNTAAAGCTFDSTLVPPSTAYVAGYDVHAGDYVVLDCAELAYESEVVRVAKVTKYIDRATVEVERPELLLDDYIDSMEAWESLGIYPTATYIPDESITSEKYGPGSVDDNALGNFGGYHIDVGSALGYILGGNTVAGRNLRDNSVMTQHIMPLSIREYCLDNSAVTTAKLQVRAVTLSRMANAAVNWDKLTTDMQERLKAFGAVYFSEAEANFTLSAGTVITADANASNGSCVKRTSAQISGTAWYGPVLTTLKPGYYWGLFRLKYTNKITDGALITIDCSVNSGGIIRNARILSTTDFAATDEYQTFAIPVDILVGDTNVEFRGVSFVAGIADLSFDYFTLIPMTKICTDLLEAYAVTTYKLAANSVTAEKLVIGTVTDNMIFNPSGEQSESGVGSRPIGWRLVTPIANLGTVTQDNTEHTEGGFSVKLYTSKAFPTIDVGGGTKAIPIVIGDVYAIRVRVKGLTAGAACLYVVANEKLTYPSGGDVIGAGTDFRDALKIIIGPVDVTTDWLTFTGIYTPSTSPSGLKYASICVYLQDNATCRQVWVSELECRKQLGTVHIEDGAIVARKIALGDIFMEGFTWTNDGSQQITWTAGIVYYLGVAYNITAGSTVYRHVWWVAGNTSFTSGNTKPSQSLTAPIYMIAINAGAGGIGDGDCRLVANNTYIDGRGLITGSVTTSELHFDNLTADPDEAFVGTVWFRYDLDLLLFRGATGAIGYIPRFPVLKQSQLGENIILNPGFGESLTNGIVADHWSVKTLTGAASGERYTDDSNFGGACMKLYASSGSGNEISMISEQRPINPSTNYRVEGSHKKANGTGNTQLYVNWFTRTGTPISTSTVLDIQPTTSWLREGLVVTSPSDAAFAQIELHLVDPALVATYYWDNISMSKQQAAVSTSGTVATAFQQLFGNLVECNTSTFTTIESITVPSVDHEILFVRATVKRNTFVKAMFVFVKITVDGVDYPDATGLYLTGAPYVPASGSTLFAQGFVTFTLPFNANGKTIELKVKALDETDDYQGRFELWGHSQHTHV